LSKNFPGRMITSIHMEYFVLRTISLVHVNYGLIESLIEITYLNDHHNRIQPINIMLVICGFTHHIFYIHQAAIIQLPPLQLVREILATAKYFPSACRLCFAHTDITTSQTYIMGIRDQHKRYYPSFI
jgi:hypothetical protein